MCVGFPLFCPGFPFLTVSNAAHFQKSLFCVVHDIYSALPYVYLAVSSCNIV